MSSFLAWFSLAFFGFVAASGVIRGNKKIKDRKEALLFAHHVKREIMCFMSPMDSIVSSFKGESFIDSTAEGAPDIIERLSPNVGAGGILSGIMKSDAESVGAECERLCAVLREALEKEQAEYGEKRGVRVIYPLFCGAVLFIMLI